MPTVGDEEIVLWADVPNTLTNSSFAANTQGHMRYGCGRVSTHSLKYTPKKEESNNPSLL